ncbi:glycoside hydrolase family 30 protein [Olivibacter sitiensis]|uniref:glycoside hydrolase family 30 protein n=1 Tax=Olivibacter sitiensis TaxID=376470 RepID=UPI0003F8962F|nr:glycoside hydrolase family 30 protein [Olivibacter sitiensis]
MDNKIFLSFAFLAVACTPSVKQSEQKQAAKIAISKRQVELIVTAKDSNWRLTTVDTLQFRPLAQPVETDVVVFVDPAKTFQEMVGIGGAITDASAEVFAELPEAKKQEFLRAYYDKERGIGYSLARTNINSCDFSSGSYTYVSDGDSTLSSFDIAHDKAFKIPLIEAARNAAGNDLPLFVSPWSPPAWMKDNKNMLQGGKLLPQYRGAWAAYYIKFIQAYEQLGIPVWGLTVQNEPMATQTWESCLYTAEEERDFIKEYLGPALHKAGMQDKKLIAWDHNRDLLYQRASTVLHDPEAAKYVWGIGYHWYETWTGAGNNFESMQRVKEAFPDKQLIFTEGCIEKFDLTEVNSWRLGEHYGKNMIHDFNNGTAAWCDWNILLDEKGGPNHVGNFCFAPVHADLRSKELIYTSAYYYIGHFSKYIKSGAKRIVSSPSQDRLLSTAFINPDGGIVVVVMNPTDDPIDYKLWIDGAATDVKAAAHSIGTLLL